MRMTINSMKDVAKHILVEYSYRIQQIKKTEKKSAESEINIEELYNERSSVAAAFTVLGLITDAEADEIAKKKHSRKEIEDFQDSAVWNCAMAKTDKPVVFNIKFD